MLSADRGPGRNSPPKNELTPTTSYPAGNDMSASLPFLNAQSPGQFKTFGLLGVQER